MHVYVPIGISDDYYFCMHKYLGILKNLQLYDKWNFTVNFIYLLELVLFIISLELVLFIDLLEKVHVLVQT